MAGAAAQEQRVVVMPAFYTQDVNNIHHGGTETRSRKKIG
jgi:hypothetical protein